MPQNPLLKTQLYLASASPRRRQLLDQLHCQYQVVTPEIDESPLQDEIPADYVSRLAISKALAGWSLIIHQETEAAFVIGADTCISLAGEIIGKPVDIRHAQQLLAKLSDRSHDVYSAVAIIDTISYNELRNRDFSNTSVEASELPKGLRVSKTQVSICELSVKDIAAYCATGEPMGKAGGYAIQGRAAEFIKEIKGSYSGVVGLPLYETAELFKANSIN